MGCPEAEDLEMEDGMDVHMHACVQGEGRTGGRQPALLTTIPVKGPMGRIWGVGGSPGQKAEWLNKKRVKTGKSPPHCPHAPS